MVEITPSRVVIQFYHIGWGDAPASVILWQNITEKFGNACESPCITHRFLTMQHTVMYQPVLRCRRVFVTCFLQILYSAEGKGNDLVKTNLQLVYPKPLLLPLRQQPIFKLVGASDKQRILFLD